MSSEANQQVQFITLQSSAGSVNADLRNKTIESVNKNFEEISKLIPKVSEKEVVDAFEKNKATTKKVLELLAKEDALTAAEITMKDLRVDYTDYFSKLNSFLEKQSENSKEYISKSVSRAKILLGIMIAFAIGCFALGLYFTRTLVSPLIESNEILQSVVEGVNGATRIVEESSREIENSSNSVGESIESTTAIMTELTQMIQSTRETVDRSVRTGEASTVAARKCQQSMDKLNTAMSDGQKMNDQFIKMMQGVVSEIDSVVTIMQEISAKTGVINDIVFQTKLLSFNASVEAARAGEYGKGFAVVAEEIGNLATLSGSAANQIGTIVGDSVSKVTDVANSTKNIVGKLADGFKNTIEKGHESSQLTSKELNEVLSNIEELKSQLTKVLDAAEEQSRGVDQVARSMKEMSNLSDQNLQGARTSFQSASELVGGGQKLEKIAEQVQRIVFGNNTSASSLRNTEFESSKSSASLGQTRITTSTAGKEPAA